MRLPFPLRSGLLCSALFMTITSHSVAFEQGSYHVIDLVENADAQPVAGRLAVPKSVLAERDVAEMPTAPLEARGEFEIDYSKGMGSTGNSAFEFDSPVETEEKPERTNFSTGTFDFGSSNTVFGE